jgi:hypothetical protein
LEFGDGLNATDGDGDVELVLEDQVEELGEGDEEEAMLVVVLRLLLLLVVVLD